MISQERLQQVMDRLKPYLKEKYLNIPIPICKYGARCTGKSALLVGISNMLEKSLKKSKEGNQCVDILLKDDSSSFMNNTDYSEAHVPAMLVQVLDTEGNEVKKIYLTRTAMEAYVKQDSELFLLKFSPLIDISKITEITISNYKDCGITEFIRFTNLIMCFDPKINLYTHDYILNLDLEPNYLTATFFVRRARRLSKMITKIDRSGRLEKVPINDADKIFTTFENETKCWYGVFYETRFVISHSTLTDITQGELIDKVGDSLTTEFLNWKRKKGQSLDELAEGDIEYVQNIIGNCVVCCREVGNSENRIYLDTLPNYREVFNNPKINIGAICSNCSLQFYTKKKSNGKFN